MDVPQSVENKVNELLNKFRALDLRHKIQLGLLAAIAIMVIIAFFFVKSSFGKITVDRSVIDSLQVERDQLKKEREALHAEIDYFRNEIQQRQSNDSAMMAVISRQSASLTSINNKISTLKNGYKTPTDYNTIPVDSLTDFFSNLHHR